MKNFRTILSLALTASLTVGTFAVMHHDASASDNDRKYYLATFIALYEYNMGMEHAQFPSGQYTDNIRTDVLYYAVSEDGTNYTVLNNNRPVLFPLNSVKLGSPSLFRKADGTYGLIAGVDNSSSQIFLSDSKNLVTFSGDRTVTLNNTGINVMNPSAQYNQDTGAYDIYWEGGDGNSYLSTTSDFNSFSEPVITDYRMPGFTGILPAFADTKETSVFMISEDEYQSIINKYGEIKCVSVDGLTINISEGDKLSLPEKLDVRYSDGSTTAMGVRWDTASSTINFNSASAGTYTVKGVIQGTTEYDNPIARFRADPYILYNEEDDYYYFTASYMQDDLKNPYDYVAIKRAKTINGLRDAEEIRIFAGTTAEESGVSVTPDYWAPEIHKIGGKYRIIVQGTVDGNAQQCILTCVDGDLMNPDSWEYTGYVENSTPYDMTYLECGGQCYYITQTWSSLGIATFDPSDPTKLTSSYVRIALPDRAYDKNVGTNQDILEGPAVIVHDNKVFLTYSGSTIDMHYCTNLLYADADSNLMNPDSWTKLQTPLFTTTDLTTTVKDSVLEDENGEYEGQMGPGHSNFTVDENGNLLLVYHARDWSESYATGNDKYGLSDPGRHAYVKCIHFGADGMPIFNMTPEQILSDELRHVSMTINVKGNPAPAPNPSPAPGDTATVIPANTPQTDAGTDSNTNTNTDTAASRRFKKGYKFTYKTGKYKITRLTKTGGNVTYMSPAKASVKKVSIPAKFKYKGKVFKVTALHNKAFKQCRKLKKITLTKSLYNKNKKLLKFSYLIRIR